MVTFLGENFGKFFGKKTGIYVKKKEF